MEVQFKKQNSFKYKKGAALKKLTNGKLFYIGIYKNIFADILK